MSPIIGVFYCLHCQKNLVHFSIYNIKIYKFSNIQNFTGIKKNMKKENREKWKIY